MEVRDLYAAAHNLRVAMAGEALSMRTLRKAAELDEALARVGRLVDEHFAAVRS